MLHLRQHHLRLTAERPALLLLSPPISQLLSAVSGLAGLQKGLLPADRSAGEMCLPGLALSAWASLWTGWSSRQPQHSKCYPPLQL